MSASIHQMSSELTLSQKIILNQWKNVPVTEQNPLSWHLRPVPADCHLTNQANDESGGAGRTWSQVIITIHSVNDNIIRLNLWPRVQRNVLQRCNLIRPVPLHVRAKSVTDCGKGKVKRYPVTHGSRLACRCWF